MTEVLKSVLYGLLSGMSEIIPVSSRGHQSLLMQLFGMSHRDPVLDIFVHIGILVCVFYCCKTEVFQFIQSFSGSPKIRKSLSKDVIYENHLLKSALLPLIITLFFYSRGTQYELTPLSVALFFVINGVMLFIPDFIRQSNKRAGQMGILDSLLIGLSGIACIFPGISRIGVGTSVALVRGADKQNAFNWVLLLTIPVMVFMIVFDIISLFTVPLAAASIWLVIGYVLSAAAAFAGSYIGITLMRFLAVNSGFSSFAYYSWGAAAFTFVLHLAVY